MGGGGKGGGGGHTIYRHHMTLHVGICAGPIDELTEIILGDRTIWKGSIKQSSTWNLSDIELFGGDKREGGIKGAFTVLFGDDDQIIPMGLRGKLGDSIGEVMPDYRGITTIWFHEQVPEPFNGIPLHDWDYYGIGLSDGFTYTEYQTETWAQKFARWTKIGGRAGFYWQASNPYLRKIKVRGRREAKGLDRRHARIYRNGSSGPWDTNGAHIIYECQVNRDFGASIPISKIDLESFATAAKTLYDERFGISMKWVQQSKVKEIIEEVLDHINAVCFEHPRTGLVTLRLLRDDYDPDELPIIDGDNAKILNFQRKHEELINEVVVTYTNPESMEDATVTVQDLAGIAVSGGIISTGRNYYAVRRPDLATDLGERDLRAEGYPLASCEVEVDRTLWELVPGDVVKLNSPEDDADELIMRALKVDDDAGGRKGMKVSLIEDIFSLEAAPSLVAPQSLFVDSDGLPLPAAHVEILTLPYTFSLQAGLNGATDDDYPIVHSAILAASTQSGAQSYDLLAEVQGNLGTARDEVIAENAMLARGTVSGTLPFEVETTGFTIANLLPGPEAEPETILMFGSGDDEDTELAGVTAVDEDTGELTLRRGLLDTVPREWPDGTPVWVIPSGVSFIDTAERSAFETVEYKVLPRTSKGVLAENAATIQSAVLSDRPYLPFRPADVTVGGMASGQLNLASPGDVAVTWKHRNRSAEDAQFFAWDEASVTPETGQTTKVTVMDASRNVLTEHDGLTGTSFTIPETSFQGVGTTIVRVTSERDGYESLQGHEVTVIQPTGYGYGYGAQYGGS